LQKKNEDLADNKIARQVAIENKKCNSCIRG